MTNQFILSEKIFNREKLIAIIALFIATVAISFATIFVKWSEIELSANATVFNRLWIATVIFAFWNSFNLVYLKLSNSQHNQELPQNNPYTKNVILLLLALGAVYLGFQTLWAWSITQTSIAISTVLHNLTPLFTTLVAWLFLNKHFEKKFLIGMLIAIVGMIIIAMEDIQISNDKISGDILALLSAIFSTS